MATLLIVEDDRKTNEAICEYLKSAGHMLISAYDGAAALQSFDECNIDLIVLDIMLPKISGLSVLHEIRQKSSVPVLMLTAIEDEYTQVTSFDEQADDYITKPFSIKLVLKRVEALLRRTETTDMGTDIIRYKELQISAKQRQVLVAGAEVILTQSEFDILLLFLKNQGRVFTRDELLNLVWGYEFIGEEKSVNFHIMNLRKKLGVDYIETVRGVGYKIAKENQ